MRTVRPPREIQQGNLGMIINEWRDNVTALSQQISTWANEEGWAVEEEQKQINEEHFDVYEVPVVTLKVPSRRKSNGRGARQEGSLILEPIARNFPGFGIVELYAYPTLYRVRLISRSKENIWEVLTDSGISLHQEWNKANFVTLADDLLAAGR